jgi:maltose O-acetyltransferase
MKMQSAVEFWASYSGASDRKSKLSRRFAAIMAPTYFLVRIPYANFGIVMLDCATITIGDNVLLAPNVQLYTAYHPVDPTIRASMLEAASPTTIGHNVWIGGGAIVLPGVSVGDNTIVGAGSVVIRSLPHNVVAAGNPCRVFRAIDDSSPA